MRPSVYDGVVGVGDGDGGGTPVTTTTSSTTTTTTTSTSTTTSSTSTTVVSTTVVSTVAPSTTVGRRGRRTTTSSSVRAVVITSTTVPVSVTSTSVGSRVVVETVVTSTSVVAGSATTLPLVAEVSPGQVQSVIASRESNVQDLSVPVFVDSKLPEPEPENPLVIQTGSAAELDIITINDQVVQLQDTEGFRLSVSATDADGVLAMVNTKGAIVVERENFITVTGEGFKPGSDVVAWLFSEPRRLGVIRVSASGAFEERLRIGVDVPAGDHTTQINGITVNNEVRSLNLAVEVIETIPQPTAVVTDTTINPIIVANTTTRNDTSFGTAMLLLGVLIGGSLVWFYLARRRGTRES